MARYLDRLNELELSRRIALQHEISRGAYQQLLEREQINNLQRQLDLERRVEIDRNLALEAEALRRREIEARVAEERELELQRALAEKARAEDAHIRAIEAEIAGVRSRIDSERLQQNQLNNEISTLTAEISNLYSTSQERERGDLLALESLDEQLQKVQMALRESGYKRNAYRASIDNMQKLMAQP